ncbi:MAG: SDR family oxidoreductase, partial [Nannocystaceae bacterium]
SAMRDRAPELPEVDAAQMASLQTLAQIVEHMQQAQGVSPAATATVAAPTLVSPDVRRFVVEAVPAPAAGLGLRGLTAGEIQVTDDGRGIADALVGRLRAAGLSATKVAAVSGQPVGVVFLGALAPLPDRDAALALNREAFLAAKARSGSAQGVFVTVQSTGGDFGLRGTGAHSAWTAGLAALTKTAALEWPEVGCKAIDLAETSDPEQAAEHIASELLRGGPEVEVGLQPGGVRITLDVRADDVRGHAPAVTERSVIVASGGARGVTAQTLVALAASAGGSYVLLGRTPLVDEPAGCEGLHSDAELKRALVEQARERGEPLDPAALGRRVAGIIAGREVRRTLQRMTEAGARARYVAVDVTDASGLREAFEQVRREWGPITGIVHGAGVLADRTIADKTLAQFELVFDTKIRGLLALLEATAADPIDLLVLFSSVAARGGNRGQCDYAMANEVLNKVGAAIAAERGIKVKSMGWGPWEGGMVTPQLARHFESLGVPLIPLEVGARMLVDEVQGASTAVELVLGGRPTLSAVAAPTARGLVHVGPRHYPFIDHHRVEGVPVVPVVVAAEWLARAALACCPALHLTALRDLEVVRGIRLESFDDGGTWLSVDARRTSNGEGALVEVQLRDDAGQLRYRATAELSEAPRTAPVAAIDTDGLQPWGDRTVYDGTTLFHGPALQVISTIDGVGHERLVATLDGAVARPDQGEGHDRWRLHPGLLDGALQLALLWAEQALRASVLPMRVGELRTFATDSSATLPSGRVTAEVRVTSVGRDRATCEVRLVGEDHRVIAVLREVETIRRPDVTTVPDRSRGAHHRSQVGSRR